MKQASRLVTPAIVAALVVAQALFVASYVDHERTIYFWDHAMYFNMAKYAYFFFAQDFSAGWALFKNSLAENYNLIYTLPALASFKLFGVSRIVFILVNFFVFFITYEVAIAFLLRRALNLKWGLALIISFVSCALVPPLWLPLLEGYPDIGAAACVVCAAALALNGPGQSRIILRGLILGLVLGLAVLLRRHFVYADLALLITLVCFTLWDIWRAPGKSRRRYLGRAIIYFTACGFGFAAILALIAPEFLKSALTVDYHTLYLSYQRPPVVFLRFVFGGFGFGLLLMVAGGLVVLAQTGDAGRRLTVFATLFTFLWLAIWCGGPDQMGHHYILHALPVFMITGLVGWYVFLDRPWGQKKYIFSGALLLGLIANSAWALWFSPTGVWPNDNGRPGLLSAPRPSVVRPDYDEWLRLAGYLQRTTKPEDHIMVVGSSFVFNLDLIHSIYMDILDMPAMTARFPKSPEIDHEEPAPLDVFAASDIYLVPTPAQYHLDPAGQRVVTAAAAQFPPPPSRVALFHADDNAFHLADDVTIKVWRRTAWTPGTLHEVLQEIRDKAPQDANFAQSWATTALPLRVQIYTDDNDRTFVTSLFDAERRGLKLFFDKPLAPGTYRLGLFAASDCANLQFHLDVLTAAGHMESTKDFTLLLLPGGGFQPFTVPAKPAGDHFLQLGLSLTAAAVCRAELRGLQIESMP